MTSTSNQAEVAASANKSLEDKAAAIVEIINSSKSQEEKSEQVWEILKNV